MTHRQYFKAVDPAILCPIAGYTSAADLAANYTLNTDIPSLVPTICPAHNYYPDPTATDPEWVEIPEPALDRIILSYSDLNEGKARVTTTLQTGGKYKIQVYGAGDVLIGESAETNTGTAVEYVLPSVGGVPNSAGYSTFKVVVMPTTAHHITGFSAVYQILEAKFNTPYMLSLASAFANIKSITNIEFVSDMNSLTTLASFCTGTTNLFSVVFKNMNLLNTLASAFQSSGVKLVTFPASLPELTTLSNTFFSASRLVSITYPQMDKLTTMQTCHNANPALAKVILPTSVPLLNSMLQTFASCPMLTYVTSFTNAPLLANMNQTFQSCNLYAYSFPATMAALSTMNSTFISNPLLKTVTMPTSSVNLSILQSTFQNCTSLETSVIAADATNITTMSSTYYGCSKLNSSILPATMNLCTQWSSTYYNCAKLPAITLPTSATGVQNASSMFYQCYLLANITFPQTMNALTTFDQVCYSCTALTSAVLPKYANALTTLNKSFSTTPNLGTVTMPDALPAITTLDQMLYHTANISTPLTLSSCVFPSTQVSANVFARGRAGITAINWPTLRVTAFSAYGAMTGLGVLNLNSLNIDFANSTFSGASPQLNISQNKLDATELNRIFTALPTVSGKTLNITDCTGAATCTKSIATAKGWTITG